MVETKPNNAPRANNSVLSTFEEFERSGQGGTPSWLQALHKGGISHFVELGFPTIANEEWRFTNVAPLSKVEWRLPDFAVRIKEKEIAELLFPNVPGKKFVFIDGRFAFGWL